MESELVARLSARSFLHGVVIGTLLRRQLREQETHRNEPETRHNAGEGVQTTADNVRSLHPQMQDSAMVYSEMDSQAESDSVADPVESALEEGISQRNALLKQKPKSTTSLFVPDTSQAHKFKRKRFQSSDRFKSSDAMGAKDKMGSVISDGEIGNNLRTMPGRQRSASCLPSVGDIPVPRKFEAAVPRIEHEPLAVGESRLQGMDMQLAVPTNTVRRKTETDIQGWNREKDGKRKTSKNGLIAGKHDKAAEPDIAAESAAQSTETKSTEEVEAIEDQDNNVHEDPHKLFWQAANNSCLYLSLGTGDWQSLGGMYLEAEVPAASLVGFLGAAPQHGLNAAMQDGSQELQYFQNVGADAGSAPYGAPASYGTLTNAGFDFSSAFPPAFASAVDTSSVGFVGNTFSMPNLNFGADANISARGGTRGEDTVDANGVATSYKHDTERHLASAENKQDSFVREEPASKAEASTVQAPGGIATDTPTTILNPASPDHANLPQIRPPHGSKNHHGVASPRRRRNYNVKDGAGGKKQASSINDGATQPDQKAESTDGKTDATSGDGNDGHAIAPVTPPKRLVGSAASAMTSAPSPDDLFIYTQASDDVHQGDMFDHMASADVFAPDESLGAHPNSNAPLRRGDSSGKTRSARLLAGLSPLKVSNSGNRIITGTWPVPNQFHHDPVILGGRRKPGTAPAGASRPPWVKTNASVVSSQRNMSSLSSLKNALPIESSRTFLQTSLNSSTTSFGLWSEPRPHTSPAQHTSSKQLRTARWRRAREKQWDASFTSAGDGSAASLSKVGSRSALGFQPFHGAHDLAVGQQTHEEVASMLAFPPAAPSNAHATRPLASREAPSGAQSQVMLNLSLVGYEDWKHEIKRDNIDWYNSTLRETYQHCADAMAAQNGGPNYDSKEEESTDAHELMNIMIANTHAELREVVRPRSGFLEGTNLQEALAQCHELMRPLFEEVNLPKSVVQRLLGDDQNADEEIGLSKQVSRTLDAARALLSYRDATVCVIHGLMQHERVLAQLKSERDVAQGFGVRPDSESGLDLRSLQLSRIQNALVQGISIWQRRSPEQGQPRAFIWRGLDALERLRADGASVGLPALSTASGLRGADTLPFAPLDLADGPAPQNTAERSALDCARGLRALFRSGGGPRGTGSRNGRRLGPNVAAVSATWNSSTYSSSSSAV